MHRRCVYQTNDQEKEIADMNLCQQNLEVYRAALISKANELREVLGAREDIAVERSAEAMDQTLSATEREKAIERMVASYRLLRQVEYALARLERGRFGICLKCEEEIETKRLDALPWALFCMDCQRAVDRLHAGVRARWNGLRPAA
jgi:DnaK suppressor protein